MSTYDADGYANGPTDGIQQDTIPISSTDQGDTPYTQFHDDTETSSPTSRSPTDIQTIDTSKAPLVSISHRKENTLLSTVITYVCTTVGAGIISLPYALEEAGWLGILVMVIVAIICTQTANWLVACMFAKPDQRLTSYEEIGYAAYGTWGKNIVTFFQLITLYGVCVIFLIIAGGNLSVLVPNLSLHAWVFIAGVCMIPVAWLKTMREVAILAYFGLFASLLVGGIIIGKGIAESVSSSATDRERQHDIVNWSGISNCINIAVFSLGSHSVLPNQVNHMKAAHKNYTRFTIYAYTLISTIYIIVAACGYAGYGYDTQDNVLNSMSPTGSSKITNVARAAITLHVLLAYPLPLNPVSLFIEHSFQIQRLYISLAMRTILVLGTIFIASVVPYFGSILTLVSALSIIVVAFVLPPIFYYLIYKDIKQITIMEKIKMILIICIGIASCVIGMYYAVSGLIDDIQHNPNPFDHYFN